MQFTMEVYAFVWELLIIPLCKVSTSKWEKWNVANRMGKISREKVI